LAKWQETSLNEIEKIASLAAEIEIAEKDLDIITCPKEARQQEKYVRELHTEMTSTYTKLVKKLYATRKNTVYRYQLQSMHS